MLELVKKSEIDISFVSDLAGKDVEHLHHEEHLVDESQVLVFVSSYYILIVVGVEELLLVPSIRSGVLRKAIVSVLWTPEEPAVEVNVDQNCLLVDKSRENIDFH